MKRGREVRIRDLQKSVEETIFVGHAYRLGVFDALTEKPDTHQGLAERLGFDGRCTRVLLEALVEMGYLQLGGELYSVTDDAHRRLVERDGDEFEGSFWSFLLYLMNPWNSLPHVLRTGQPDKSSYRDFSMDDFIRGMDSPWKKKIASEIVDLCVSAHGSPHTVADIGGAPGTIAREFARRGMKTIVFDLKESLDVTRGELAKTPGIVIADGDATRDLPEGPYDIAFLGNLCHGQSPEDNARIIRMCHERLGDGGIVAVFDNLRGESYLGATLALHMITQSPLGDIYSRQEYARWLEDAGFGGIRVVQLSDPAWQIMFGRK